MDYETQPTRYQTVWILRSSDGKYPLHGKQDQHELLPLWNRLGADGWEIDRTGTYMGRGDRMPIGAQRWLPDLLAENYTQFNLVPRRLSYTRYFARRRLRRTLIKSSPLPPLSGLLL
jgi:hypothetical protein